MRYEFLAPQKAWEELCTHRNRYYRRYIAAYNGDRAELSATSENGLFWSRAGKAKVHVPVAADIATTSSDLLFSEEPTFTCYDEQTEDKGSKQQKRLDTLISLNAINRKLSEGAETCAALGDVYLKLNWFPERVDYPVLSVVQGDSAWAEYFMGELQGVHFFSVLRIDSGTGVYLRLYERYEKGYIYSGIFRGDQSNLGLELPETELAKLGLARETKAPINELLAAHIPNVKPNRRHRDSEMGRSDFDELRPLMDSLDEAYSSWMRDIRLAKARLIVPAEYLRRKASDMFKDGQYTYEFDEDIETLVALDIDPERGANTITPSQFAIRSEEHAATCSDIIRNIITIAGYSPQTFGLEISGAAQSGTALNIRRQKSYSTRGKKENYWKPATERILTSMIHLDAALFPNEGSEMDDEVKMRFAAVEGNDISTMSSALQMLNSAAAVSTEMKVQMLHPDWTQKQVDEEIRRVKAENGLNIDNPDAGLGDLERADRTPIAEEYDSPN